MESSPATQKQLSEQLSKTVEEIRAWRIQMAEHQLENAAATVDELIKRGLIEDGNKESYISELKQALKDKLKGLKSKLHPSEIDSDELDLCAIGIASLTQD